MKQKTPKLIKKTAFVFRRATNPHGASTDPTTTSVTIIATETVRTTK